VEDPATAAAVMLCSIAQLKGPISENTRTAMINMVRRDMQMPDGEEIVDFAKWVAQQVVNPGDVIRAYKNLWTSNLGPEHLERFIEMASEIADMK